MPSQSPPPRISLDSCLMTREPLFITIPPPDHPVEVSRFSPESPPAPSRSQSTWTNTATMKSSRDRDVEAAMPNRSQGHVRDRLTKMFFNVRMLGRGREPDLLPIQATQYSVPELKGEKCSRRGHCDCAHQHAKRQKHQRLLLIMLILILLYLMGNVVFLNSYLSTAMSTSDTQSTFTSLSVAARQCLSQYDLNAPTGPSAYPCSTCLPVLQDVPSNFSDNNAQDAQQIQNAVQFCGLRSIFQNANSDGQTILSNGGWVKDVRFCAWSGVSCDGSGRVFSLQLNFPAVPASIPTDIGALTGLHTLQVTGDTNVPAGTLPSSFTSLTLLSTLELQSSAITSLPDGLFSSLDNLTTLTLVRNTEMSADLPSSIFTSSLQNIVVNDQALNNPLSALSSSDSLQLSLKILDLSSTSLSGNISSSISSLTALAELHLDNNDLNTPIPPRFPPSLQILTLRNNTELSGVVSGSFCSLSSLQICDMTGTGLSAAGSCGICQFT
ncbi:L domain-like protein [Obba rivulosa]|uniref:L domain-like protein n=1 Tax=Obba rivulosa TaxID=1052685 RepID=A0A8E2AKF6_9APHY|nr:L domain-like protein [Obba rivulosa]